MLLQQELPISELSQDDLTQVLQRAQSFEIEKRVTQEASGDIEAFLKAAEEIGIGREAVVQALREKLGHPQEGFAVGDRVFAKSADGAFYVATISELKNDVAKVSFLHGADHTLPLADLRSFALLPGRKIQVKWPFWGWWDVETERFDPKEETVTVNDGFSTKTFPLWEARLPVQKTPKTPKQQAISRMLFRVGLLSAGAGGIIGAILMRLFS